MGIQNSGAARSGVTRPTGESGAVVIPASICFQSGVWNFFAQKESIFIAERREFFLSLSVRRLHSPQARVKTEKRTRGPSLQQKKRVNSFLARILCLELRKTVGAQMRVALAVIEPEVANIQRRSVEERLTDEVGCDR